MIQYELWATDKDGKEGKRQTAKNIWEYNREDCLSLIELVD